MATKRKIGPMSAMMNKKSFTTANNTTTSSASSSSTTTTDFELMLDTLPTPPTPPQKTFPSSANSSINNGSGQTKKTRYIKDKEYAVNAYENGQVVLFRITELIEKPEEIEMHDSLQASVERKISREKLKIFCRVCRLSWQATTKGEEFLKKHIIDKHMTILKCDSCNLHFETIHLLHIHKLSHYAMCFGCKKKFALKTDLDMHLRSSTRCAKYHKINGKTGSKIMFQNRKK